MSIIRVELRSLNGAPPLPDWTPVELRLPDEVTGLVPTPPPAPQPPAPTPPSAPLDAFDFAAAIQHDGPPFTTWPATSPITRLEFRSSGVFLEFPRKASWPDVVIPGWVNPDGTPGTIYHSLGMAMRIDGVWHVSAPVQVYRPLEGSGGPVYDQNVIGTHGQRGQVGSNWFYDGRWGALQRQPAAGEPVGFFAIAGSTRGGSSAIGLKERTNVVVVPFPGAPAQFTF
jgi:hypothetical protein